MNCGFVVWLGALSLVASVTAQEQTVARAPTQQAAPPNVTAPAVERGQTGVTFDAKGADFTPWLRSFKSKVRRNWFVPLSADKIQDHVDVTFIVHRNGTITDVVVDRPSEVQSLNLSARNAIAASSPVEALPAQYPDDSLKFAVTFYYNEGPRPAQNSPPPQ